MKYLIKFTHDKVQYSCECEIECEDNWKGIDIDDNLAFEVNVFQPEDDGNWWVNVYKLNPDYKQDGLFTMDEMELIHGDNGSLDYFEPVE